MSIPRVVTWAVEHVAGGRAGLAETGCLLRAALSAGGDKQLARRPVKSKSIREWSLARFFLESVGKLVRANIALESMELIEMDR